MDLQKVVCPKCGEVLEYDVDLSQRWNKFRAWMWRQGHRLNCGADLEYQELHQLSDRHGILVCKCGEFVGNPTTGSQMHQATQHFLSTTEKWVLDRQSLRRQLRHYLQGR